MASPPRERSNLRNGIYSAIVTVLALVGLNALVGMLEEGGVVDTHDPDDVVQFVDGALFQLDGNRYTTTPYAEQVMLSQSFAKEKGEALRVFIIGASFAMGTPYQSQGRRGGAGGIDSFLWAELTRRMPGQPLEIINAASGGADSGRVSEVAKQVADLEPDAIFVATCNNDAHVAPSQMRRLLQEQPGYRLLRKVVRSREEPVERTWYAPQDQPSLDLEKQLRENITTILDAASANGVPVLLATLPVNLRYPGFNPISADIPSERPDLLYTVPTDDAPPIPDDLAGLPPCESGVWMAWAGEDEAAVPLLIECAASADGSGMLPPFTPSYLAMAELRTGRVDAWAEDVLRETWGDCLTDGMLRYQREEYEAAVDGLLQCEELAEALQWVGLSRWRQDQIPEAKAYLRQAVELDPRNRCRPSLNEAIRDVAASREGVTLVDLEKVAEDAAEDGLPGPDLFLDSCHMNWRGYATMAGAVIDGLEAALPGRVEAATEPMDISALGAGLGLPAGDNRAQVRHIMGQRVPTPAQ